MPFRSYHLFRFSLLIGSVFVCGVAEGMLLPLISALLDERGVSPIVNGIGTTALYIGMLAPAPFMEKPMQRLGYKPFLFIGLMLITLSLALFPLYINLWFWFILRLAVGIGDSMLHFAAQTWITIGSPHRKKGRNIALYGLSFGLGFAAGPLLVRLLAFGLAVPFIAGTAACLVFLIPLILLKNEYPETPSHEDRAQNRWLNRCGQVVFAAWSGLIATFGFGFLEASLNNSFPIFALRNGFRLEDISSLLPMFVAGGLLTQLPIGVIGDRFGRARLLPSLSLLGAMVFILSGLFSSSFYGLLLTLSAAGMLTGSLYSMSMGYVSDMLDTSLIPLGNILMSVCYSFGSMAGPIAGNTLIGLVPQGGLFYGISLALILVTLSSAIHQSLRANRKRLARHGHPVN
ncbi:MULTISPECIES: MFS transporter [unclassified Sporolactobacillus]|uniref:MFS transporter n=1 Tax=unclassified Sporolactobacillus TaxID=2628533 RepID=UPI0023677DD4|nr:MFS transporter [Sporolactobacillus sp. CQH2019]MDD9150382.1 MFS transporter [Sporolactobacillus sp. CQH2019]